MTLDCKKACKERCSQGSFRVYNRICFLTSLRKMARVFFIPKMRTFAFGLSDRHCSFVHSAMARVSHASGCLNALSALRRKRQDSLFKCCRQQKKKSHTKSIAFLLARQEGLEPPTFWFVAKHSIQLSYWRIWFCQSILSQRRSLVKSFFEKVRFDLKNTEKFKTLIPDT